MQPDMTWSPELMKNLIVAEAVGMLENTGLSVAVVVFKPGLANGIQSIQVGGDNPAETSEALRLARLGLKRADEQACPDKEGGGSVMDDTPLGDVIRDAIVGQLDVIPSPDWLDDLTCAITVVASNHLHARYKGAVDALRNAVEYADASCLAEGMHFDQRATRLTLNEINQYGAFHYEFDVKAARAALETVSPQDTRE